MFVAYRCLWKLAVWFKKSLRWHVLGGELSPSFLLISSYLPLSSPLYFSPVLSSHSLLSLMFFRFLQDKPFNLLTYIIAILNNLHHSDDTRTYSESLRTSNVFFYLWTDLLQKTVILESWHNVVCDKIYLKIFNFTKHTFRWLTELNICLFLGQTCNM